MTNGRNAALWVAACFFIQQKFNRIDYNTVDPSTIWDRSLSILQIVRVPVNPNDHRIFQGHPLADKIVRATLWTAEHISASAVISHEKIIPGVHFHDAAYRRYIGQPAAVGRKRMEEKEPPYLPVLGKIQKSGTQRLLGIKRNPNARKTKAKS